MMGIFLTLILLGADTEATALPGSERPLGEKLAPWASLLEPGLGELLRGYKLKGEVFLWADGAALTGAAGFGWDAANKSSASRMMAVMNADANPENRSRAYLAALEEYLSSEDYNLGVAIDARKLYPHDLQAQQSYITQHSFSADDAWLWASDSLRLEYVEQRAHARAAQQTSQSFMGVMVLVRLVSLFDVAFFSPMKESRVGVVPTLDRPGIFVTYRF